MMEETYPCGIPRKMLDRIYNSVEASIKGSATVLSQEGKDELITEEMRKEGLSIQTHPNVHTYLVNEFKSKH